MQERCPQPLFMEKLIASLSYLTFGFVGFIWLLIAIFTKNNIRSFLRYHIFQSIFIAILYFLIGAFLGLIMNILSIIPFVNQLILQITFYFNAPLLFGFSLIQAFVYAIIFYLVITCCQGKYSYIIWVSDIIKANVN